MSKKYIWKNGVLHSATRVLTLYIPVCGLYDTGYQDYMLSRVESTLHDSAILTARAATTVRAYTDSTGMHRLCECVAYTLTGAVQHIRDAMSVIEQQANNDYFII